MFQLAAADPCTDDEMVCNNVYDWTGSERAADVADVLIGTPLALLGLLLLFLIVRWILHRLTRLVERLEASAQDSTRTVRVVSIKGVDPFLVQQAIDAIQGRRTPTPSSSNNNGSSRRRDSGGSSGFVPFGTGGFVPGSLPGFNGGFRGLPSSGGGRGGGGDRSPGRSDGGGDGGSRFFADRVKDDPERTLLYDPQQDHDWLREHGHDYAGCWVAVHRGRLLAADPDLGRVMELANAEVGPANELITRAPERRPEE